MVMKPVSQFNIFFQAEEAKIADIHREMIRSVRGFYGAFTEKALKTFPLANELLKDMVVLSPTERTNIKPGSVMRLAARFPQFIVNTAVIMDNLHSEVVDYKLADDLPQEDKIDRYWGQVSKLKVAGGSVRFPILRQLMKILLVIPHSNAASERTFSMLRNIDTMHRSDLQQGTICALLSCKLNSDACCYDFQWPDALLDQCKQATLQYNIQHKTGSGATD